MDRKPPSRLPLRLMLLGVVAIVAIAAGHAVLWRNMASQLDDGWRAWVALRRAQGWRVEHGPPVRGGWPLSATLTMRGVRLDGAAATLPGGLSLTAESVVLRVTLPRLDRLNVELPGQQRPRLGGTVIPFTADSLVAVVPLEPDTPPAQAEVTAERLRIGTPAGALEMRTARLTAEGSSSATEAEPALELSLAATGIELPPLRGLVATNGFGRHVDSLAAEFAVSGPMPPGRVPESRAEAWRDGGGTVELRSFDLRWGPATAAAAATLAFDEALQPMGAGTLRLAGAPEALDALAEAGVVGRRAAATARAVLPLLSRPSAETGAPEIEVPLTLEDRTLALARIPVLRFGRLDWPASRTTPR